MNNPLLQNTQLPKFSQINLKHIKPAITSIIKENQQMLIKLLQNKPLPQKKFTWQNLMAPLESMNDRLEFAWGIVHHLNAVMNNPKLRKIFEDCLPIISKYTTELRHNVQLFRAIENLARSDDFKNLSTAQQKVIHNELRDFRLDGITLSQHDKHECAQAKQHLAKLANKFANNVLDATQGWYMCLTKSETSGIPEHALTRAREAARSKRKPGWLFTLDMPSYEAVLTYANSRKLRQKIYTAYITRASNLGPQAGKWDNSEIMLDILQTRKKLAGLVFFNNYAEYSLITKMTKKPQDVLNFLNDLAQKSIKTAKDEYETLCDFALKTDNIHKLQPWDMAYISEKYRQMKYALSDEELRPYFPEYKVLSGLFLIAKKLFGIKINEVAKFNKWHKDVRFFEILDDKNVLRGHFYLDLYAREGKRSGAWMDNCKTRRILKSGKIQTPIAYLICNFNTPVGPNPALFTHREVKTLFHEFGHCLQHLLTKVDYAGVSGINGVPWDAVELSSQFMEFWTYEPKALKLISEHYQTKKQLPLAMLEKLKASRNYLAGIQMLRQLEFALFDFRLHLEFDPLKNNQIQKIIDEVRSAISIVPVAPFNRMQHSFQHIFSGGYAAGYFCYKISEVLAADAFSLFSKNGIFDRKSGRSFLQNILERGGEEDPLKLFKKFRGREPKVDALLKYYNIQK